MISTRLKLLEKFTTMKKKIYGNTGFLTNSRLSISGGGEKTSFYLAGSVRKEDGIVKNTGYKNNTIRLNLDHKVTDRISLGVSSTYMNTSSDRGITNNDNAGVSLGVALSSTPTFAELHQDAQGNWPKNDMPLPIHGTIDKCQQRNDQPLHCRGNINAKL
jgi:hypothetical protein